MNYLNKMPESTQNLTSKLLKSFKRHEFFIKFIFLISWIELQSIIIYYHEFWADEGQAWVLARSFTFKQLILSELRYDGHPILWFIPLRLLNLFGFSVESMKILTITFNLLVGYLILFRSPFKTIYAILILTSYDIAYQYGIVSRNYSILMFLIFYLAYLWDKRTDFPIKFSVVLCLLANTHLHGFFIVIGISLYILLENAKEHILKLFLRHYIETLITFFGIVFVIFTLKEPANSRSIGKLFDAKLTIQNAQNIIEYAFCEFGALSYLILAIFIYYLYRLKTLLLFSIPTIFIFSWMTIRLYRPWHNGILVCWLITCIWIGLNKNKLILEKRIKYLISMSVLPLLLVQTFWTFQTYYIDFSSNYSGSKAIANYINKYNLDRYTMASTSFFGTSILAYLPNIKFINWNHGATPSYWNFRYDKQTKSYNHIVKNKTPDIFIISNRGFLNDSSYFIIEENYELVKVFSGFLFIRGRRTSSDAHELWCRRDLCNEIRSTLKY